MRTALPLLLLLACGGAAPAAPPPAAPPPAAPAAAPSPTADVKEPAPDRPPTPSPAIDLAQAGLAANAWSTLAGGGCDPVGGPRHAWTPIEARILRNVPYALRGYAFSSAELTRFFSEDGRSWYEGHTTDVVLPEAAKRCVEQLKAHETTLRAVWPLSAADEARLTTPQVFEALQAWGAHATTTPYGPWTRRALPDGGWSVEARDPACSPGVDECATYVLQCPADGPCVAMAAG